MAVHDDSNGQKNKSSDVLDEIPTFNVDNMQNNTRIINYSRTFMSIIGGVIAGILGYNGLMGFVFYFIVMAITTVGLAAKTGFSVHSYFDSWNKIIFDGILGGLLSFVLFWTYPSTAYYLYNIIVFLACIHICMLKSQKIYQLKHNASAIYLYNIIHAASIAELVWSILAFRCCFVHTHTCIHTHMYAQINSSFFPRFVLLDIKKDLPMTSSIYSEESTYGGNFLEATCTR